MEREGRLAELGRAGADGGCGVGGGGGSQPPRVVRREPGKVLDQGTTCRIRALQDHVASASLCCSS